MNGSLFNTLMTLLHINEYEYKVISFEFSQSSLWIKVIHSATTINFNEKQNLNCPLSGYKFD